MLCVVLYASICDKGHLVIYVKTDFRIYDRLNHLMQAAVQTQIAISDSISDSLLKCHCVGNVDAILTCKLFVV